MDCREDWSLRAEHGLLVVREGRIVARWIFTKLLLWFLALFVVVFTVNMFACCEYFNEDTP